jgi:hypothetical protein
MNRSQDPQVRLTLHSSHGRTEVRVNVSLRFRLPGPWLMVILLAVASIAIAALTHDVALYRQLIGSRP